MITAQLRAAPQGEVEHLFSLPHAPEAAGGVRRRVRGVLAEWNLTAEAAADVLLVVSELVTNAIVHALPPATLRVSRDRGETCAAVRVEVTDTGPAASPSAVDPDEHGRGLEIVSTLSERCGVRVQPGGTCRWAELRVGEV
ncbi:ATP-binding protein [Streptomyces sp. SS1-1]|uniref:ATP-binding protein n=1 Tax=unclassified Streptomyces TaxID=2593676 RepID=UPI0012508CB0|nr:MULTISPECIES: ATP-binding protein [unclassified Streptomyces]KAB2975957.1 ATP-binding protein [Streptomyces sp. SS1-1]MDI9829924.1 ATP-binding protein [Streptomyces sp. KAU_LT]